MVSTVCTTHSDKSVTGLIWPLMTSFPSETVKAVSEAIWSLVKTATCNSSQPAEYLTLSQEILTKLSQKISNANITSILLQINILSKRGHYRHWKEHLCTFQTFLFNNEFPEKLKNMWLRNTLVQRKGTAPCTVGKRMTVSATNNVHGYAHIR